VEPVATYGCESWTLRKNEETRLEPLRWKDWGRFCGFRGQQRKQNWSKEGTVRHHQSKEASILWSHHEETRELPGERNNARNNAKCTQARKATHGLDGQHQDVNRTLRGRINQNDRGQGQMEKVRPWCNQPSDRGRLKKRTERLKQETVGAVHVTTWLDKEFHTFTTPLAKKMAVSRRNSVTSIKFIRKLLAWTSSKSTR